MLTPKDKQLAEELLHTFMGKSKLEVREATPLSQLMGVSVTPEGEDVTALNSMAGVNVHDVEMERVIEMGVNYLRASQARARGGALPIINDVVDTLQQAVTRDVTAMTEFNITPIAYPSILEVPSFLALAEIDGNYTDTLATNLPPRMLPAIDFDATFEHVKLGIAKIDDAAKADGLTAEMCKYIYASVSDDLVNSYDNHVTTCGNKYAVLGLVVIRAILLNEDKFGVELPATVRNYLEAAVMFFATRIRRLVALRERNFLNGKLITGINGRDITVNGDSYNKYLRDGGRPEVIMGGAINGLYLSVKEAKARADEMLDSYDSTMKSQAVQIKSMRSESFRRLLPSVFFEYIKDMDEYKENLGRYRELITQTMHVTAIDSKDIYPAVRQLVCSVLYPNTDTLVVLSRIDDLMKHNPDMDAADAATTCYVSLLTDFFMNQIIVSKV